MHSGQLRHRINIESPPTTVSTRGGRTGDWSLLYENVPASVKDLSGFELIRAQKNNAEAKTEIRIRYHAGINTTQRIVFGDRVFHLLHINNIDQRNIELVILANEVR